MIFGDYLIWPFLFLFAAQIVDLFGQILTVLPSFNSPIAMYKAFSGVSVRNVLRFLFLTVWIE